MSTISLGGLVTAALHYEGAGYLPLDVPMLVDASVSMHTKPYGVPDLHHNSKKVYVASGEQSFIQMNKEGSLPQEGRFQCVTPCYRHERFLDQEHQLIFLKLELIDIGVCSEDAVMSMVDDVLPLFKRLVGCDIKTEFTEDGIDLTCNGVELGSYGLRKMPDGTPYCYGTGLALPRISLTGVCGD